jgi:hypothetical protein
MHTSRTDIFELKPHISQHAMVNQLTKNLSSKDRSVLRQIEDLLPQIEEGLAAGYSHAAMHAQLPALGINISLKYYHLVLHKLRKEKREGRKVVGLQPTVVAPSQSEQAGSDRTLVPVAKDGVLPGAFVNDSSGPVSTMVQKLGEPKSMRWDPQAADKRDISTF